MAQEAARAQRKEQVVDLDRIIDEKRREDRLRELGQDKEQREREERWRKEKEHFNHAIRPKLRKATARDYRRWLEGWVAKEGKTTHYYDRPLDSDFYVVTSNMDLPPYYGASSISLIVPEGIEVTFSEGLGHNNIYFMDSFDHAGSWVPLFDDI